MKTKGLMGIGTLIIFIAIILVAAIAAGVIITTAGVLESKALNVGNEARERLVTNIEVVSISGADGSVGNNLENISVTTRLAPGSPTIRLNDTVVTLSTSDFSSSYGYDAVASTTTFNVTIEYGDSNDYLEQGELITMNFFATRPLIEDEEVIVVVQSKSGGRNFKIIRTPNIILNTREYLYP